MHDGNLIINMVSAAQKQIQRLRFVQCAHTSMIAWAGRDPEGRSLFYNHNERTSTEATTPHFYASGASGPDHFYIKSLRRFTRGIFRQNDKKKKCSGICRLACMYGNASEVLLFERILFGLSVLSDADLVFLNNHWHSKNVCPILSSEASRTRWIIYARTPLSTSCMVLTLLFLSLWR